MSYAVCQQPTSVVVISGVKLRELMLADYKMGFKILQGLSFMLRDRIQGAYGALENI